MTDRDKVIKGLESLRDICNAKSDIAVGSGKIAWAGYANAAADAVILLKEQEAVKPIEVFRKDTNCHEYYCKRCGNKVGTILGGKHPILPGVKLSIEHFCDVCGQEVKWDESDDNA